MLSKEELDNLYMKTLSVERTVTAQLDIPQTLLNESDLQELDYLLDKALKCMNVMYNRITGCDIFST